MKAITVWQPWASLLACGAKKYETRSWATSYRGPIAIHAGKKEITANTLPEDIWSIVANLFYDGASTLTNYQIVSSECPLGAIIATAELVGCWEMAKHPEFNLWLLVGNEPGENGGAISGDSDEVFFGDWTPGRYAWEFANMKMLPEPIPARGGQRIWNWEGVGIDG